MESLKDISPSFSVQITGVAVITLSALTQTYTTNYGSGALPDKANDVLIGLETVASMIIILGAFGMLVSCCCQNKLFLYTVSTKIYFGPFIGKSFGSCLKTGQHFIFVIIYLLLPIKCIIFDSVSKILFNFSIANNNYYDSNNENIAP